MADWRQIQARIRKAKTSSDPAAQLADLYQRTRDAMVAFELAQWHEKSGNSAETVQWYTTAAQRFRRAQWRTKAQEALTRLGAPIPDASPIEAGSESPVAPGEEEVQMERSHGPDATADAEAATNSTNVTSDEADMPAGSAPPGNETASAAITQNSAGEQSKRRRRGRRGGRKRHGRGAAEQPAAGAAAPPVRLQETTGRVERKMSSSSDAHVQPSSSPEARTPMSSDYLSGRSSREEAYDLSQTPAPGGWQAPTSGYSKAVPSHAASRGRAGDPGLSSRIAQLESQLRRLLACPLCSLDEAEQAPAGPGVLLLSDADQVTHYYVEACQTLRIGVGNLIRGGRGSKGGAQLKPSLAEHLGINDSKVSKYLKDHCAVRWIQLDEGSAELAHFAVAVLRPVVTE